MFTLLGVAAGLTVWMKRHDPLQVWRKLWNHSSKFPSDAQSNVSMRPETTESTTTSSRDGGSQRGDVNDSPQDMELCNDSTVSETKSTSTGAVASFKSSAGCLQKDSGYPGTSAGSMTSSSDTSVLNLSYGLRVWVYKFLRVVVLEMEYGDGNEPVTHVRSQEETLQYVRKNGISLEGIRRVDDGTLLGTILVRDEGYKKDVAVRHSTDSWTTFVDIPARWLESVEGGEFNRFEFIVSIPRGDFTMKMAFSCNGRWWDKSDDCTVSSHKVFSRQLYFLRTIVSVQHYY